MKPVQCDRVAGRGRIDSRGFPIGCVGLEQTLTVCTAELSSQHCALCERVGLFPLPAWWRGEMECEALAGASVQVVPIGLPSLPWAVIAFLSERYVDGRFPIIGAASAKAAIDLTLARAVQLRPRAKLERNGEGEWLAADLRVICRTAGRF